ncbi:MAG TPA: hypothetical protein VIM84_08370 [Gemmatimonadales bacterium]
MYRARHLSCSVAVSLALAGPGRAQQSAEEPQRVTLIGLRAFAVHARVQVPEPARLLRLDEGLLRGKLEQAIRGEGMVVQGSADLRDGSAAQLSLVYQVIPIRDASGEETWFAASSCLQAFQYVRIPRLEAGGRIAYTVAPTWRSCSLIAGDTALYEGTVLQNADEQIQRFLSAWRSVNLPRPASPPSSSPQLGTSSPIAHPAADAEDIFPHRAAHAELVF